MDFTRSQNLKFSVVFTGDTVRRPLEEAFLASKIVILDYFSRELPFQCHHSGLQLQYQYNWNSCSSHNSSSSRNWLNNFHVTERTDFPRRPCFYCCFCCCYCYFCVIVSIILIIIFAGTYFCPRWSISPECWGSRGLQPEKYHNFWFYCHWFLHTQFTFHQTLNISDVWFYCSELLLSSHW